MTKSNGTDKRTPGARGPKRTKAATAATGKSRPSQASKALAKPSTPVACNEWLELFPHGISVSSNLGRPVLILKDKSGGTVLPVWMNPLDAGVALAELSQGAPSSHAVTLRLMDAFGLRLESCAFEDLIGHHQFVNLVFRGNDMVKTLRLRADEAMSFCLQARARFYGTKSFMARCRDLDADLSQLEQSLVAGQLPGLQAEMEYSSKKHPYVM